MRYLSALILTAAATVARGQAIGGVSLKLGMSGEAALSALRAEYRVSPFKGDSVNWLVHDPAPGAEPFASIGNFAIRNHRLVFVSRRWPIDGEASDAVGQVMNALAQLKDRTACGITTQDSSDPDSQLRLVKVDCGDHYVTIVESKRGKASSIDVNESWNRP